MPALDRFDVAWKAALEDRHWWYAGRRAVVSSALARLRLDDAGPVLDAGCGTGHNLEVLARFGPVSGVDVNTAALELARARGVDARCASIERLPFEDDRFGLVACLDVLEHVDDDRGALHELRRVSRTGGTLLLTVPAYPGLFSEHDLAAGHVRRYSSRSLLERVEAAGWRPVLSTHFNAVMLPAAAAYRRLRPPRLSDPRSDLLRTPAALDRALVWPLRLEALLIKRGRRLPAGLSLLVALRNR